MRIKEFYLIFIFLLGLAPFLHAAEHENHEPRFTRRIVWRGGEHAWRYAVEIEKFENGSYREHLREYTTELYAEVSLPPGEFRFRIIPYDILGRPGEGTQWMPFVIHYTPPEAPASAGSLAAGAETDAPSSAAVHEDEPPQIISVDDYSISHAPQTIPETETRPETAAEHEHTHEEFIEHVTVRAAADEAASNEDAEEALSAASRRFNSAGISAGTAFTDPLVIVTINGTYSPIRNFYIELGCEFGFISEHSDVDFFYCIYPYLNLGFYMPFTEKTGIFASLGGGYMAGGYSFEYGTADINTWGLHFKTGANLFNFLNVFYILKTNFSAVSHKLAVGYTYRFR